MSSEYQVQNIDGPVEVRLRRIPYKDGDLVGPAFYVLEISGHCSEANQRDPHRYSVKLFAGAEPPVVKFENCGVINFGGGEAAPPVYPSVEDDVESRR